MENNKKFINDVFIQSMEDKLNKLLLEKFGTNEIIKINLIDDSIKLIIEAVLNNNEQKFKVEVNVSNVEKMAYSALGIDYETMFFDAIISQLLNMAVSYIKDEKTEIKRKIKII